MVQLLELENENIILFNDENITEDDVIKYVEMGECSSYFVMITKNQYENIFKSKNSIIKEFKKECLNPAMEYFIKSL